MAKSVDNFIFNPKLKVLVYSIAGVGKTYLAGTAGYEPAMAPVLVLNLEGGLDSIAHMPNVNYENIRSIKQLEKIMWSLRDKDGEWDGVKYKTVAIDSASEMQLLSLDGIVQEKQKRNANRNIDDVYLEDYGTSTRQLVRIFRGFRDLDMHVIFTCLPRTMKDGSIDVLLTPKLAGLFRGFMSFVWYEYIAADANGNYKRWLMTEGNSSILAKSRGHGFNSYLQNTFKHIIPQEYIHMSAIYKMYLQSQKALVAKEDGNSKE